MEFSASGSLVDIVAELESTGFALVVVDKDAGDFRATLERFSDALSLGAAAVPSLYLRDGAEKYASPFQGIQTNTDDEHPGFSTTAGQGWHVDGLLDDIGTFKTTILYCVRPAVTGGETILFNAVAAFDALRGIDPEAARTLESPTVLERRATIPGVDAIAAGPVFATASDGTITTRFTDNETCTWNETAGSLGSLERGLSFLRKAAQDPRYSTAVRMATGEALIFRNDRLAHGRTAYQDSSQCRRLLIRSLYRQAPKAPAVSAGSSRKTRESVSDAALAQVPVRTPE